MAVAVEVGHGDAARSGAAGAVGHGVGECAVAVVQEDADGVVAAVAHDDVRIAVAVEVADGDAGGRGDVGAIRGGRGEAAAAVAHEDGDVVAAVVGHRHVKRLAGAVEVADGHGLGPVDVGGVGRLGGKDAAAVVQEDFDAVVVAAAAIVCHHQVRIAVAEIADGDALGPPADGDGAVRGEGAVAVAQENRDRAVAGAAAVVGHGQVEFAVAVEVADRHGVGMVEVRGDRRLGGENAAAVAQQDLDAAAGFVGHHQVRIAVAVEVAHRHAVGRRPHADRRRAAQQGAAGHHDEIGRPNCWRTCRCRPARRRPCW